MTEGIGRFAARIPVVWHVVEAEGLPGVLRHGLLPAAAVLRRAGLPLDGENREDFQPVPLDREGGTAVLRFQIMPDDQLLPTLAGEYAGQPARWRALINSHVFFWADPRRRDSFLRACRYSRARSPAAPSRAAPAVLAFDTARLLEATAGAAYFSTINTGSTVRGGARTRRDEHTFRPVSDYRNERAAELAIRAAVPPEVLERARLP